MAYAGKAGRLGAAAPRRTGASRGYLETGESGGGRPGVGSPAAPSTLERPAGSSASDDRRGLLQFASGLVLGAILGAGGALLAAPRSGAQTRAQIARRSRRLGVRARDAWDDLGEEFRHAATLAARRVRRGASRGRWAVEDRLLTRPVIRAQEEEEDDA
jgi:hypothetical protein